MTLTLRNAPRTGRTFQAFVLLTDWEPPDNDPWVLWIGVKTTAGPPTTAADFANYFGGRLIGQVHRVSLYSTGANNASGQLAYRGVLFTETPGANVKVYAALSANASDTTTFADVSPGVLLGA